MVKEKHKYIGFGLRLIAYFIDNIILSCIFWILPKLLIYTPLSMFKILLINLIVIIIVDIVYEIFLTYKYGGTIGKILMKCKVVDLKGNYPSLLRSTGRYFSKILSVLVFGLGYLMILLDPEKQGLHDKIAKTWVIDNPKSKIKDKLKKILIILSIAIVVGYILLYISMFILGVVVGIQAIQQDLDPKDPFASLDYNCDSKIIWKKDACIAVYSEKDKSILSLNTSLRVGVCSKIRMGNTRSQCLLRIAISEKNKNICLNTRSSYYTRICEKAYDQTNSFKGFFENLFEEDRSSFGSLGGGTLNLGVVRGEACADVIKPIFYKEDVVCFTMVNISGFELGKEGDYSYNADFKVWKANGELLSYDKHILEGTDKIFLPNNGTLDKEELFLKLEKFEVGEYTYEIIIYDKIGNKLTSFNQTLNITDEPLGKLDVERAVLGKYSFGRCFPKSDNLFVQQDFICLEPVNVKGFERQKNQLNWFDMDIKIRDSEGRVIKHEKNLFGADGHVYLVDNTLNEYFVYTPLKDFKPEEYIYEVIIYDKISNRRAVVNKTFIMIEGSYENEEGAIMDTLEKGEVKTYTVGDLDYEIEVMDINFNPNTVRFQVNGMLTEHMGEKEVFKLMDLAEISVIEIYEPYQTKGGKLPAVKFNLFSR